jgi:hypothetical protein
MTRTRVIVVLASLVLIGIAPERARSQNPSSLGWSSMSMFAPPKSARYGLTSQTQSADVEGDPAPATPPSGTAPVANPFAPRPVSEVFNPPTYATPSCTACSTPPPCIAGACCPTWSPIVAVESTFFWPQLTNGNTFVGNGTSGSSGPLDQQFTQSNEMFIVGPRVTFGAQGPRWGVLGGLWYASNWANGFSPADTASGTPGFSNFNSFQAYTADLAMQRRWGGRLWNFWGFGGVRYGSVNINHRSNATQFDDGYMMSSTAYTGQSFQGTGITFGGYGTRAIGNSPFALFFSNRYSILWGDSRNDAQAATALTCDTMTSASSASGMTTSRVNDLFIAELQMGTQWQRQLVWFPGRAFLRAAFEYQYWNTGGICASAQSTSLIDAEYYSTACAEAKRILFNMVGFNLGGGIIY